MSPGLKATFAAEGLMSDGLPFESPDSLIAAHKALIDRLILDLDPAETGLMAGVHATLGALAEWVQLLPASEGHHHAEAGGLLRHSLEVAAEAVRLSLDRIGDPGLSGAQRRRQEERFRLSALIAGLCHDLGKPVADLTIIDPLGQATWNPWVESLWAWGQQRQIQRFHPIWRAQRGTRHRLFPPLLLSKVVDRRLLSALREGGPGVEADLLEALLGDGAPSPLARLLREADGASVQRDLRDPRRPLVGLFARHPASFLIEAMRARVRDRRWEANRPGQPLWHLEDGLYLAWPAAALDLAETLSADGLRGIPLDPELLALFLEEQGLAVPPDGADAQGSALIRRQPPGLTMPLRLLRLRTPRLLYPGLIPDPVEAEALQDPPLGLEEPPDAAAPDPLIERLAQAAPHYFSELTEDRLFLDHQEASKTMGMDVLTLIRQLDRGRHLNPDTQGGSRKVRIHRGRRGVVLNPESTRCLLKEQARQGALARRTPLECEG